METVEAVKARADAMCEALTLQRNEALDKCAVLSAQLRMALAKIGQLEGYDKPQPQKEAGTDG